MNASEWRSLNAVGMSCLDWDGNEVRVGISSTELDCVGQMRFSFGKMLFKPCRQYRVMYLAVSCHRVM